MMSDLIKKMKNHREEIDPDIIADISFIFGDLNYRLDGTYDSLAPIVDKLSSMRMQLD